MSKPMKVIAILGTALALAGCASSAGNTTNSIAEVRTALESNSMRVNVADHKDGLLEKSESFSTSFELERDLFVCEQLHPIPASHEDDHPESEPLAECIRLTFEAHQGGQA